MPRPSAWRGAATSRSRLAADRFHDDLSPRCGKALYLEFNRFDVSTKELVWDDPEAWLERFGIGPRGPVELIDSDITALTAAADKVVKVGGPDPYLVNIEFQTYHDLELTRTLWFRQPR